MKLSSGSRNMLLILDHLALEIIDIVEHNVLPWHAFKGKTLFPKIGNQEYLSYIYHLSYLNLTYAITVKSGFFQILSLSKTR